MEVIPCQEAATADYIMHLGVGIVAPELQPIPRLFPARIQRLDKFEGRIIGCGEGLISSVTCQNEVPHLRFLCSRAIKFEERPGSVETWREALASSCDFAVALKRGMEGDAAVSKSLVTRHLKTSGLCEI